MGACFQSRVINEVGEMTVDRMLEAIEAVAHQAAEVSTKEQYLALKVADHSARMSS